MTLPPVWIRRIAGAGAIALGLALLGTQADASRERKPPDLVARMPPLKPAVIDETLVIEGEDLAARKLRSRLTVEIGVNDTGPYRFVVDSGADTSVIGSRLAAALMLPAGRPVLLNAMTESTRVDRVLVSSLQVGPTTFYDLELPRLYEHDIGASGMLGLDALVNQRLVLDFEKSRITIDDASRPAPRMYGEIVVVARLKRGQLILTQVKANGIALDAVIDTGSEISIGNTALRDQIVRRKSAVLQTLEMTGVTGKTMPIEIAIVPKLQIGGIILTDVPVAFSDVPPFGVFNLSNRPALLLGTDLMENFRKVSLDFRARKVRFQLRKCASEAIVVSTVHAPSRLNVERGNTAVCD